MSEVAVLGRALWFIAGALVGTSATLLAVHPWTRAPRATPRAMYESLPLADNSGVCQEYVALASLRTTYADAASTAQRLSAMMPAPLRTEHMRVVRALAAGEHWTIAVDSQAGVGELSKAEEVATQMNALPGTGLRFAGTFYGARALYDAAGVLCMPRQGAAVPALTR